MRLLAFTRDHQPRIGALTDAGVINLTLVDAAAPTDLGSVVKDGKLADVRAILERSDGKAHHQLNELDIQLPISMPGKILCLGLNYMDHIAEGPFEKQPFPAIFMRGATSLVAANKPILAPSTSNSMDYEAELAVIIGASCKDLKPVEALDVIAGYSCFNDGSVREYQRHSIQWTMGKNFDQTGPFGPFLVTPDELPPAANGLKIECRLNGRTVQASTTDMMIFKVVETLVYITKAMTLNSGDIVIMGTPSGVGHGRTPPLWMRDGDIVEVEIEKIGCLTNPVKSV